MRLLGAGEAVQGGQRGLVEARNSAAAEVRGAPPGAGLDPEHSGPAAEPATHLARQPGCSISEAVGTALRAGQLLLGHGPCQAQAVLCEDSSPKPRADPQALQ